MSEVELTISANVDAALKEVAGFRKEYADMVKQVEKPLRQVNTFRELETTLEQTGRKMAAARDRVRELGNALASTEAPSRQLTAEYRQAVKELRALDRQEQSQIGRLGAMRRELQASGVDTRNLAAEQRRLAQELSTGLQAGRADAALASAKSALGVGAIEQEQRALLELRRQYQLVTSDSTLSAKQRAEAEATYRTSVSQTLASLRELRAASAAPEGRAAQAAALQEEARAAASAARENQRLAAARALGVGAIEQNQRKLVELRSQYRLLTSDGTLSGKQRAEAEANYRRGVESTLTRLRELRQATTQQASATQQAAAAEATRHAKAKAGIAQLIAEQKRLAAETRVAAIEAASNDLGVTRARAAEAAIQRLQQQYQLLRTRGSLTTRELAIAQETMTRKIRETRRELAGMASDQQAAGGGGIGIGRAAGAVGAIAAVGYASAEGLRAYAEITDASKRMNSQLKLATASQEEFNRAQEELFRIAQNTSAPIEEVVKVYARLSPALDEIGRKNDAIKVVDALTKALKINGSTSAETGSVLLQFSQAMGSGVLRGEEFNAIAEAAPPLMRELAKGLGVPTGALRGMAAEGQLTAEVITDLVVKALPSLTEQAKTLPDTVEGAMTRLRNDVLKAFGEGDSSKLVAAINSLADVLSDPGTVAGLNNLAAALATIAGGAISAAGEFSDLGTRIGYMAAKATGSISELDDIDQKLADIDRSLKGTGLDTTLAGLWYSEDELKAQREALLKEREALVEGLMGISKAELEAQKAAAAEQEKIDEQRFASYAKYVSDIKSKQGEAVKNAEDAIKKQVAAEKAAVRDLESAKRAQLDTQKRYADALAGLQGGGEASYAGAQALRVGARQALAAGDVEGAKRQAQAALEMLQELADAGENTYGFEGFIKSLQQIEESADQINVDKAQQALDAVKKKGDDLKTLLDSVKATTITVKMDDAALAKARQDIVDLAKLAGTPVELSAAVARPVGGAAPAAPVDVEPQLDPETAAQVQRQAEALAQTLQRQLVIPVTTVLQPLAGPAQNIIPGDSDVPMPGFATGGYTGPGGKWQPAGVVHAGEHVQPQEVVREPGALAFLERIRREGFQATMRTLQRKLRGYAVGGLVASRAMPRVPRLSSALSAAAAPAAPASLGTVNLSLDGQRYSLQAGADVFAELHKARLKFGRTRS